MDSVALRRDMERERSLVEKRLRAILNGQKGVPARLKAAMKHSLMGGGKRLRPLLVLWTYDALAGGHARPAVSREEALDVACAVEMLHTYSLIHDDLPAMDDDVLRRGRPTCHVAYDEATAILAGDALQALAFTLLAQSGREAAGDLVMILGQAVGRPAWSAGSNWTWMPKGRRWTRGWSVRSIWARPRRCWRLAWRRALCWGARWQKSGMPCARPG